MARFNNLLNAFTSGEISPKLFGLASKDQWNQACETLENFIVQSAGGASRRPGSQYISGVSAIESDSYYRLVPFVASNGDRVVFIIRLGNPATTTWRAYIADSGTFTALTASSATLFSSQTMLQEAQFRQKGDVIFITHKDIAPQQIRYVSSSSISVASYSSSARGYASAVNWLPFLDANIGDGVNGSQNQGSLTCASAGGTFNVTSSASIFNSGMVGAIFKVSSGGSTGAFRVDSYTNASTVTVTAIYSCPTSAVGITANTSWEQAAWGGDRGWPEAVCFNQGRAYFASTLKSPDTFWGSQQGNLYWMMARKFEQDPTFSDPIVNSDAFSFTLGAEVTDKIRWLMGGKGLTIGSDGREHVAYGRETALGALDVDVRSESTYGSSKVAPVRFDRGIFFVDRTGQHIRELIYNNDEDAYKANDLNLQADHIATVSAKSYATFARPRFIKLAMQLGESPVLWALDSNGGLSGLTINREAGTQAWHRHQIGGTIQGGVEPAKVLDICSLPNPSNDYDDLFIAVSRRVNGSNVLYFEKIGREFYLDSINNSSTDIRDKLVYADSARLTRLGSPGTTFTGFSHLIGQTVGVVADGRYVGNIVVNASGNVVTSSNYTEVVAGLNYTSTLKTMPIEGGHPYQTAQGLMKKIAAVTVRFYRTITAKCGPTVARADEMTFATSGGLTPLFSGDKRIVIPATTDRTGQVCVVVTKPLPCAISCIIPEGITSG